MNEKKLTALSAAVERGAVLSPAAAVVAAGRPATVAELTILRRRRVNLAAELAALDTLISGKEALLRNYDELLNTAEVPA